MKRHLRDSMIIFGIVLVALFVFLQTAFGARGLYSSQNLDYDKGYYYESDDFSLYTYSDSYDNTSKSDLISLYDTAQPIFTNVANNYYMNVCEFDSEDDSVCKEHYNQEANGNVPFNDASIFRTVDEDGDICIYINSYQIKEETTPEIFVRTIVNSISDQALDYYISEPTLTDYYNNNKDIFASVYGEEHVTDLNHFLREGLVRYCIVIFLRIWIQTILMTHQRKQHQMKQHHKNQKIHHPLLDIGNMNSFQMWLHQMHVPIHVLMRMVHLNRIQIQVLNLRSIV